ncbi:formin-like protein 10 [Oryza brachyantha]|uniref:formin-like protein 10 n=1 Tax=Oryza brachyantha TaxID=4533 RepID=UPI001ADD5E5D|nr:formin-like protein 10 [Oryza brachyantha]
MAGGRASAVLLLLLLVVAVAGATATATAASSSSSSPQVVGTAAADDMEHVKGMMECMIGCFTQVFMCAFGCMAKGPDLPLCVVSCNQKSVVCMLRCAITPPSPSPSPPGPPAPSPTPKPSPPKPPKPSPPSPPGPPYAGGRATETTLG